MEKKEPIISFKEISKSFNGKTILDKICLDIYKGEIFGLLGRSGSGKSTLLNILLGTYSPDSGKVIFNGEDITGNSLYLRKIVGLTTQENSFYDKLTVYENMIYYSNLYRVNKKREDLKKHILTILSSVGLDNSLNSRADALSGGMKRRLDFAISILHDPELLILDEPTTGLDPILVKQFWEIVKNVSKQGKTIIVITHIFPEVKENCSRAAILTKGKSEIISITEHTDVFKEFTRIVK